MCTADAGRVKLANEPDDIADRAVVLTGQKPSSRTIRLCSETGRRYFGHDCEQRRHLVLNYINGNLLTVLRLVRLKFDALRGRILAVLVHGQFRRLAIGVRVESDLNVRDLREKLLLAFGEDLKFALPSRL